MSRRRRARYQSSTQRDWIWAIGLAVAAVVLFGGGFLLLRSVVGGSGGATCDKKQFALGNSDLSERGFEMENAAVTEIENLISAGQISGAESDFYQNAHVFTHDVDAMIRERDEQTARDLCNSVLTIEADFTDSQPASVLLSDSARVRASLIQGARVLGYRAIQ